MQQVKTQRCFSNHRMGAKDTPRARSRAAGWRFGRCGSVVGPMAAAPWLLFLPPWLVFRSSAHPAQPLCPGFAQCLQTLLHRALVTNPHPAHVAVFVAQRWLFSVKPIARPVPSAGNGSARGWRWITPETSPSFCNSHVIRFKRPLSSASTHSGCQVLFLSANLGSSLNLWPAPGKRAQKAIKST